MARSRHGFTLIETLIVVSLVALLTAMLVTTGWYVIGTVREQKTKATLAIIDKILADRVIAMQEAEKTNHFSDPDLFPLRLQRDATNHPIDGAIAAIRSSFLGFTSGITDKRALKVYAQKEIRAMYFPQTWAEAAYQLALQDKSVPSSINPVTESAEVLHWVITSGAVLGSLPVDAESLDTSTIRDTDGNGRLEIVDGWGRPLRFYRWPTRLLRPEGLPPSYNPASSVPAVDPANVAIANLHMLVPKGSEAQDPFDSLGLVPSSYTGSLHDLEHRYHLPSTYHIPFVVSAGADGEFGLESPGDTSDAVMGYWAMPSYYNEPDASLKAQKKNWLYDNLSSRKM